MRNDILIYTNYDYDKIKMAFAKSFKELRAYVGFSLIELEKLTEINNPSLSRYENGKVEPSISQAIRIAETFQLTIEDFITYGLGIKPENTESTTIIERFNETIAEMISEMGNNAENSLRNFYKKVDIDQILNDYLY